MKSLKEYYKQKLVNSFLEEAKKQETFVISDKEEKIRQREAEDPELPSKRFYRLSRSLRIADEMRNRASTSVGFGPYGTLDHAQYDLQRQSRFASPITPEVREISSQLKAERENKTRNLLATVHHFSREHGIPLRSEHIEGIDFTDPNIQSHIRTISSRLGL